ncbi:RIP metalloprotease RseP [Lysinibacillus sp. 54212]|uniref:RIP metalloprotease RseP n=1 Tax=Lysinibacillus sp. 54212 TaxID=3119829 RepID=UPI002FC765EB
MQTVIAFIIIFGSLVFFHELGHFIFAKRAGIMVREFAIGMGPKIFSMMKGETLYTIRLLPIGGYVRMAGDDFESLELQPGYRVALVTDEDNVVKKIILNQNNQYPNVIFLEVERADLNKGLWIEGYDEDDESEYPRIVRYEVARDAIIVENGKETLIAPYDRQFNSKTVGQRSMAIFAGPLFNFILAFFIFLTIGFFQGIPTYEPVITEVSDDGPAKNAGMLAGDLVTSINGNTITTWQELSDTIRENPGNQLDFTVERNGEEVSFPLTPKIIKDEEGNKVGLIGVIYQTPYKKAPLEAFGLAAEQTYEWSTRIFELLGQLVTGQLSIESLSGPVGIYKTTEQIAEGAENPVFVLMHWAAILSINLGIMNLLPLPALDGGRLLFFGVEALRGKPVDRQKEGLVHFVGIVLLMILMVVVTWNDIQRFFF